MFWYRVFNENEYQDFDTFAEAESYYDSYMNQRWRDYKEMNMLEDWEEDRKFFDLSIVKMEIVLSPAD
jgi:hypothetical protein